MVDAASHQVTKYLLVGQRVWHTGITPDEKYPLDTDGVSNDVSVIDVAALKVIKTIRGRRVAMGHHDRKEMTGPNASIAVTRHPIRAEPR